MERKNLLFAATENFGVVRPYGRIDPKSGVRIFCFWVCVASRESGAYRPLSKIFEVLPLQKTFRKPAALKVYQLNFRLCLRPYYEWRNVFEKI